jgi:5-methylcytosine-specific restriction protein A
MPDRLLVACSVPGCPRRAVTRGRCEEHQKQRERERPTSAKRGYDADWRQVRDEFLSYHPHCQARDLKAIETHRIYGDQATDVDHVTPKRAGGTDDWANLQALCHRCHSRKTLEQGINPAT